MRARERLSEIIKSLFEEATNQRKVMLFQEKKLGLFWGLHFSYGDQIYLEYRTSSFHFFIFLFFEKKGGDLIFKEKRIQISNL